MCYAFIYTGKINVYHEVITTWVIFKSCSRFLSFHQIPPSLPARICVIPLRSLCLRRRSLPAERAAVWAIAHQLYQVPCSGSFSLISLGLYDIKLWATAGVV